MDILILITGGTLDKLHDTLTEGLVFEDMQESQVTDILKVGRCHHPAQHILMQKDSLDMTDDDRAAILNAVLAAEQSSIIITHGTGTMELTAKYLDGKVGDKRLS